MCGTDQMGVTLYPPAFVILGVPFDITIGKSGQIPLTFTGADYSNHPINTEKQIIENGDVICLTINEIPAFNSKVLGLHFAEYPSKEISFDVLDPACIIFKVQGLYDIQPFCSGNKKTSLLSFSLYDDFELELISGNSGLHDCKLELEVQEIVIRAKERSNKYSFSFEDLAKYYSAEQPISASLRMISGNKNIMETPIQLEFNKIPHFKIINEQEIIKTNFNLANLNSPFGNVSVKISLERPKRTPNGIEGSDLHSFRIVALSPCLNVNPKMRFESPEDLNVELHYTPNKLTTVEQENLRNAGKFDFAIDLEIRANRSLSFKPIKRFHFAFPVINQPFKGGFGVIDFGTTNSCVVDESGEAIPISGDSENILEHKTRIDFVKMDEIGDNDLLSFPQSDVLQGLERALNFKSMLLNHANQKYMFKDSYDKFKPFTPVELTRIYLRYLIGNFEPHTGKKPEEIVATYPAIFRKETKRLYFDQIRALGYLVNEDVCITEPEAIAFYYLNKHEKVTNHAIKHGDVTIAVFDCGGGTTDYAIVNYSSKNGDPITNVVASWGTEKFGGIYLSFALAKCDKADADKLPDAYSQVFDQSPQADFFREKYTYYEKAKLDLSRLIASKQGKKSITEVFEGQKLDPKSPYFKVFSEPLSEDAAEIRTIKDQIGQINSVMQELFENKQTNTPLVDFLILAGNSCRLPLFKQYAEEEFSKADQVILDIDTVKTSVALGAHLFRSRGDGTMFMGLRRSRFVFYRYLALGKREVLFKRWLDMEEENHYPINDDSKNLFSVPLRTPLQVFVSESDAEELPAFEIPMPKGIKFKQARLEMKYHGFNIYYKWHFSQVDCDTQSTEWEKVYDHE
jgi:hypothetical protein